MEQSKKNCEIVEIIDLTWGDLKSDSVEFVSSQTVTDDNILDENEEIIDIIDESDDESSSEFQDEDDKDSSKNSTQSSISMLWGEENLKISTTFPLHQISAKKV